MRDRTPAEPRRQKLVVVGNGMAGIRTLEELLRLAPDLYEICVFGAEAYPNYNRVLLSAVLSGELTFDEIVLNPLEWYADHGIRLHGGTEVIGIDRHLRRVRAADGTEEPYDRLLIATGSHPVVPSIPGKDLDGVVAFRDIEDARTMIERARSGRHAVVVGGGLLGLEAASGLAARGMEVTVLHRASWLMERQLDEAAATLLQRSMRSRGLALLLGAQAKALAGNADNRVTGVRLQDGTEIPADLVVVAAGTRPSTFLAERAGLHCDRGIVVHDTMQTITDPRIYAVGECAAHRGVAYGLVAPAYEQAQVCANHLARSGVTRYRGSKVSTQLKVSGDHVFSAGNFMGAATGRPEDARCEEIVLSDPDAGIYTKLVILDDKLVGACLVGDSGDSACFAELLREGRPIGDIRDTLMFGRPDIEARTGATVC